jgi:RNA polymerase sigma-54 factor
MKNDQRRCLTLEIKKFTTEYHWGRRQEKPYPDDQLAELLKEKGYPIARRTIKIWRTTDIPTEWGKDLRSVYFI